VWASRTGRGTVDGDGLQSERRASEPAGPPTGPLRRYVGRRTSFGHAAARLVIAQQTLSAQIGELEHRLGVTLFVRDRRSVALTTAGTVFVEGGRRLLADAADLVRQARGTTRPVRIDVITEGSPQPSQRKSCEPPAGDSHRDRPEPRPDRRSAASEGRRSGLYFGRVHGYAAMPRELRHILIRLDPIGVVLPAGHELARLAQVPVLDLADTPLLVHTAVQAEDWEDWIEQFITRFGLTVGRRLRGHGRGAVDSAVLAYRMPALGP